MTQSLHERAADTIRGLSPAASEARSLRHGGQESIRFDKLTVVFDINHSQRAMFVCASSGDYKTHNGK